MNKKGKNTKVLFVRYIKLIHEIIKILHLCCGEKPLIYEFEKYLKSFLEKEKKGFVCTPVCAPFCLDEKYLEHLEPHLSYQFVFFIKFDDDIPGFW